MVEQNRIRRPSSTEESHRFISKISDKMSDATLLFYEKYLPSFTPLALGSATGASWGRGDVLGLSIFGTASALWLVRDIVKRKSSP